MEPNETIDLSELRKRLEGELSESLTRGGLSPLGLVTLASENAACLRTPCTEVGADGFNDELRARAARLVEIMHEPGPLAEGKQGIGLAANQAGWMQRVFTAYVDGEMEGAAVYVNPRIIWRHARASFEFESCLSCPKRTIKVRRPNAVTIEYQDVWGTKCFDTSSGLLARVWQHEIDHLNGVLIVDKGGF